MELTENQKLVVSGFDKYIKILKEKYSEYLTILELKNFEIKHQKHGLSESFYFDIEYKYSKKLMRLPFEERDVVITNYIRDIYKFDNMVKFFPTDFEYPPLVSFNFTGIY